MRITLPKLLLLIGDLVMLYAALFIALVAHYGTHFYQPLVDAHLKPFSIIFPAWLIIFYIAGLYDFRRLRNNIEFLKTLGWALFVNAILSMLLFYLIPAFGITPKTNLVIFVAIFALLETVWRRSFNAASISSGRKTKVILIGSDEITDEIEEAMQANPQLGYEVTARFNGKPGPKTLAEWKRMIETLRVDLIVIPRHLKKESNALKIFCELLASGIEVRDTPAFYETVFRKIPITAIDEEWILDSLTNKEEFHDGFKRAIEFILALLLGILLLPLELLIALAVKLTSRGPAIYRQTRIGKNQTPFTLYKFRTMRKDAEAEGAQWAQTNDARVTPVGKFLRYTHLDELPQLFNIAKGELSFVGPRPERPEFAGMLSEKIPYYDIRHLVKPGFTGWAQIEYRYGASVEDAAEKLKYDLYYLKNRSLLFDAAIFLKTLKLFFIKNR
jgi:exopolysaccharide biosynthesis polyprenyl glycosylphosphotransferase